MKFKKITVATFATLSLLAASCTAVASPTIRHNASCSTKNQIVLVKNITYKCAPINKKLVWRAVRKDSSTIKIPQSTSSAQVDNSFKPWSNNFSVEQMSNLAQKNFLNWANENSKIEGQHAISTQNGLDTSVYNSLMDSYLFAVKSFNKYGPEKTISVVGLSHEWVLSEAQKDSLKIGISYPIWSGYICSPPNQNSIIACASKNASFFIINNNTPQISNQPGILSIGAHEYFHVIQYSLLKTEKVYHIAPAWLLEGSADFVGYAIGTRNIGGYYKNRNEMFWKGQTKNYNLKNYWQNNNHLEYYPYDIGRVAVEYLVASGGFDKFLNIFAEVGNGKSLEEAFIYLYGITLNDFYVKFEQILYSNKGIVF